MFRAKLPLRQQPESAPGPRLLVPEASKCAFLHTFTLLDFERARFCRFLHTYESSSHFLCMQKPAKPGVLRRHANERMQKRANTFTLARRSAAAAPREACDVEWTRSEDVGCAGCDQKTWTGMRTSPAEASSPHRRSRVTTGRSRRLAMVRIRASAVERLGAESPWAPPGRGAPCS